MLDRKRDDFGFSIIQILLQRPEEGGICEGSNLDPTFAAGLFDFGDSGAALALLDHLLPYSARNC
ncbi:MAG TPA: hypothetical protein VGG03_19635 [Thermoanaerobaculia bacterium]